MIKWLYKRAGWSGFWRDATTGRWYAYAPEDTAGYWSHEAERRPLPTFWQFVKNGFRRL